MPRGIGGKGIKGEEREVELVQMGTLDSALPTSISKGS